MNFIGDRQGGERGAYGRLIEVKSMYDPTNLFRMNQNIRPSL